SFGAPYECYHFEDTTNAVPDQFAVISRGPDRLSSTNRADNACVSTTVPSLGSGYVGLLNNKDNVVYPRFTDSVGLLNYQHLGTLNINIQNYDSNALVAALVQGCPHYYIITVSSVGRPTTDSWPMLYNAGAASMDLVQGVY